MFKKISKDNIANVMGLGAINIEKAAQAIIAGELVAFPTETVYGLGADVFNIEAVLKIFEVKGRPFNDPLIVHVSNKNDIYRLAKSVTEDSAKLIGRFWPGPLTLVMRKSEIVPDLVTAGLDTVAIRMPDNTVALNFIEQAQTPIAAPSANLFGRPSPTCIQHVIDDLGDKIDFILDGGSSDIGVESTVIDMTCKPPKILRPGGVSLDEIITVLGEVELDNSSDIIKSPGMLPQHYSPNAELILVEIGNSQIKKIKKEALKHEKLGKNTGIMVTSKNRKKYGEFRGSNIKVIGSSKDLKTCANNLYKLLREFDGESKDVIIAEGIEPQGLGLAIMDRLRKASGKKHAEIVEGSI